MFTTLSTALSALNANSVAVSVVGNDLANLNTTGYKSTQVEFQDLISESVGGLSLGMGTSRPLTTRQFTEGGLQTGLGGMNAALQGQGFFIVNNGQGGNLFTRDGTFSVGANGTLVDANGQQVQGWAAGTNGTVNTNGSIGAIPIPSGTLSNPVASTKVSMSLNLDSAAVAGTTTGTNAGTFSQPITVYDSLGAAHTLTATFTKNQIDTTLTGNAPAVAIAGTDTAVFTVSTNAGTQTVTVDAADGTIAGQVAELNSKLSSDGITASLTSAGQLQFASASAFSISGVSTGAANLVPATGTAATANNSALNSLLITPSASGPLAITVGGTTVTTTVGSGASGAPTAADVAAVNAALSAQGITGVTAILDETTGTPGAETGIELQGSATFSATDASATLGTYTPEITGAQNAWNYNVTMPGSDLASGATTSVASGTLTFDPKTGKLSTPSATGGLITLTTGSAKTDTAGPLANGAVMNDISWNLYDPSGNPLVTQVDQPSAVSANTADGSPPSQLTQVAMGNGGQILAQYSDGTSVSIGQLAIANIPNPNSLLAVGNNDFQVSSTSLAPIIGTAGTGGRGDVLGGALEQSTVDIATEFSALIQLQNAYQANSRVVTTEDQILQQTVSLVQP